VTLLAGTVLTPDQVLTPGWATLDGRWVSHVGAGRPRGDGRVVELGDRLLAPGFVDVHVHGGDGAEVNGDRAEDVADAVRRIAAFHARYGTTGLVATTVSDSPERLVASLRGIGHCTREGPSNGARVLGAHLEGPWLAREHSGVHDVEQLRAPTTDELERLLDADPGVLRMVTLAPELPGALDVVAALSQAGVVVSVGHTAADLGAARAGFDAGARHATHLFNGMPPVRHRHPGPVVAALTDPRVTLEIIADGVHVDPAVLGLVLQAAAGRVVAVTDAMAATGLPLGRYSLGGRDVDVTGDRVALADEPDTLAGSVLTMDLAVRNLVAAGASLPAAVTAATLTPARALGDSGRGRLVAGAAADLVVLDPDLTCVATIVDGRAVFDPQGILEDALS
jgi:N-acetylglucosamine-6-phosphate deacetylase